MKNLLQASALAIALQPALGLAQGTPASWEADVRQFDARYWQAFNNCEVQKLAAMNTADLEFYHDTSGVSKGVTEYAESIARNICARKDVTITREERAGSVQYFPMREGDKLYGAIVSGEHLFYSTPTGGKKTLTGQARFTHMLLLQGGVWKVSRVLSFDHGPARLHTARAEVTLSAAQLGLLAGRYVEKDGAFIDIKRDGKRLALDSGKTVIVLKAGGANEFFASDRPLTVTFARDRGGKPRALTVREEGEVVAQAIRR